MISDRIRARVLQKLASEVLAVERAHPVRVAVDGCSAAGKTTLADELADVLRGRTGREVIRAEVDHFKRAPELRTTYPLESPESYYYEVYDNEAIRARLLEPLGPGGNRRYTAAIRESNAVTVLDTPIRTASPQAILIADGCFLQRPELNNYWDLRIYVHVPFETVLHRGANRDAAWMPSLAAAEERYRTRYIPGEQLYVSEVHPAESADLVVHNEDPASPVLTR
ncbi:uridine kinase [Kribbella sp. NPDC004536]|uniref:uridine kinase n=1 Tax=Kribbella sp. NPDC004536 TaxID=3364106 RepID=UPI0036871832